jgi:DNA-binding response OmpR family regulator
MEDVTTRIDGTERRLRILVVEDDANISGLIAELLAEIGHDVCAIARTEREAVAAAEAFAPDLMIVDITLRVGGGVAAMDAILRRTAMPHIFMTGGLSWGIPANSTVLYKPFGKIGLMSALNGIATRIAAPVQKAPDA